MKRQNKAANPLIIPVAAKTPKIGVNTPEMISINLHLIPFVVFCFITR